MRFTKRNKRKNNRDDYAIILDIFLEFTKYNDNEIAQAIGTDSLTLLELIPKEGIILNQNEKVYIGPGKRDKVLLIRKALNYDKLKESAKTELLFALIEIVKEKEKEFIDFLNEAGPLTIRKHSLELIPGIGKKFLTEILESRHESKFKSFDDIKERFSFFQEPEKAIAQRLLEEIKGNADLPFLLNWYRKKIKRDDNQKQ